MLRSCCRSKRRILTTWIKNVFCIYNHGAPSFYIFLYKYTTTIASILARFIISHTYPSRTLFYFFFSLITRQTKYQIQLWLLHYLKSQFKKLTPINSNKVHLQTSLAIGPFLYPNVEYPDLFLVVILVQALSEKNQQDRQSQVV